MGAYAIACLWYRPIKQDVVGCIETDQDCIMKWSHVMFSCVVDGAAAMPEQSHQMLELFFLLLIALDHVQEVWPLCEEFM